MSNWICLLALIMFTDSVDTEASSLDTDLGKNMCGLHSTYLILSFLDESSESKQRLDAYLKSKNAPYSFSDLDEAISICGLTTSIVHYDNLKLFKASDPCILHIRGNKESIMFDHFIPCFGETEQGFVVAEFPGNPFFLAKERLYQIWDGNVLYIRKPALSDRLFGKHSYKIIAFAICCLTLSLFLAYRRLRREFA